MEMVRQLGTLLGRDELRDVQVIATTHSPYVLDPVDFDHVCVFASRPDGSAAVKTLAQHPDADRLRGKLTAGELWTSDPESAWVLED
jgi:predicted ATP-dependent endonuclease of OLD family